MASPACREVRKCCIDCMQPVHQHTEAHEHLHTVNLQAILHHKHSTRDHEASCFPTACPAAHEQPTSPMPRSPGPPTCPRTYPRARSVPLPKPSLRPYCAR